MGQIRSLEIFQIFSQSGHLARGTKTLTEDSSVRSKGVTGERCIHSAYGAQRAGALRLVTRVGGSKLPS